MLRLHDSFSVPTVYPLLDIDLRAAILFLNSFAQFTLNASFARFVDLSAPRVPTTSSSLRDKGPLMNEKPCTPTGHPPLLLHLSPPSRARARFVAFRFPRHPPERSRISLFFFLSVTLGLTFLSPYSWLTEGGRWVVWVGGFSGVRVVMDVFGVRRRSLVCATSIVRERAAVPGSCGTGESQPVRPYFFLIS